MIHGEIYTQPPDELWDMFIVEGLGWLVGSMGALSGGRGGGVGTCQPPMEKNENIYIIYGVFVLF